MKLKTQHWMVDIDTQYYNKTTVNFINIRPLIKEIISKGTNSFRAGARSSHLSYVDRLGFSNLIMSYTELIELK